jgi:hypothetical protein
MNSGTEIEGAGLRVETTDVPANGDVLITTEGGRHSLSIVPNPHRLTLSDYALALHIARRWAEANHVGAWHTSGGELTRL